ncbi:DNA mismatch repair protein [Vibrio sp. 99-8-1]|uniref:DNA mismatch repair protein n=1 Tax=Vibrio sp. 99-8-1 TaxID=2607602 RepID=UPI00149329AB|nr:DNA mismatch repair protein [Vibrio sp. 99-8-1]NOI67333.1 DNA mismatch repair protein [Vibrio sp. 99-8-1]
MSQARMPPAWFIVLVGLILNIIAILISSVVLDKYAQKSTTLYEEKGSNQQAIQLAWNQIETLERKRELLIIQLGQQPANEEVVENLHQQLILWVGKDTPAISLNNLPMLMQSINRAQEIQRNNIDNLYVANVAIMESMQQMDEVSANYKNIALFLQILGLALILARDLTR